MRHDNSPQDVNPVFQHQGVIIIIIIIIIIIVIIIIIIAFIQYMKKINIKS